MKVFKKSRKTLLAGILMAAGTSWAGPVILMGIDAEDGGPGGHGAIGVYQTLVNNLLVGVTNGGANVLVLGSNGGDVASFWSSLDAGIGASVFMGNSASIGTQSFAGYAAIAIVSDIFNTTSGGMTAAQNTVLTTRQADIAAFVNAGGGLLGFSSQFGASAYNYVGGLGTFTFGTPPQYNDVTATAAGTAVGITSTNLDVCCWHQTFTTYPSFLNVLATGPGGAAAAIGGATVTITPVPEPATLTLLGIGLAGLGLARRRQKQEVAKA